MGAESTPLVHAFRWTAAGGVQDVLTLGGLGHVAGVSADGVTIAGCATVPTSGGYVWTRGGGYVHIGTWTDFFVRAISLDGLTVVGEFQKVAARWTSSGGFSTLPVGSLTSAYVTVGNGDGSVVGGRSDQGSWIWDATDGLRMLDAFLSAMGANLVNSSTDYIYGMSSDGKTLVGVGSNNGMRAAWIAHL